MEGVQPLGARPLVDVGAGVEQLPRHDDLVLHAGQVAGAALGQKQQRGLAAAVGVLGAAVRRRHGVRVDVLAVEQHGERRGRFAQHFGGGRADEFGQQREHELDQFGAGDVEKDLLHVPYYRRLGFVGLVFEQLPNFAVHRGAVFKAGGDLFGFGQRRGVL